MPHNIVDGESLDWHFKPKAVRVFNDNRLRHSLVVRREPLATDVLALHALEVVWRDAASLEPLHPLLRVISEALVQRRIIMLVRLLACRLARGRFERDLL